MGTLLRLKIAGEGSDDWGPGTRVGELGHRGNKVGESGKEQVWFGEMLEAEVGWGGFGWDARGRDGADAS